MRRPCFHSRGRWGVHPLVLAACVGFACSGDSTRLVTTPEEARVSTPADHESSLVLPNPEDALSALVTAFEARDDAFLPWHLGRGFVFHTALDSGLPDAIDRDTFLAAVHAMFRDPAVSSISLELEHGPAEPAGDLDHPQWMAIEVTAVYLKLIRDDATYVVDGHPARFIVGRGPSVMSRRGGWKIMEQFDLYEDVPPEGGERSIDHVTWSDVLAMYLDP